MELFRTTEHLGLKTALPQPPGNSAKALQNFVRHPHNGWLEQADGYGPKFTLPASDTFTTLISIQDIHNFYVKEHGGKQITVCVGTYKKKYRHSSALSPTRVGIWVSHTWSGVAWVEAWVELTQVEYFALTSIRDISGSSYVDLGADYSSAFATNYFQNWIITFVDYSQAEDHDNYLLCTGNIVDTSKSCLKFFGNSSDLVARSAGALVMVSRNFFGADTPASLNSHIFSLYNEIRATTGNTSSDMNFMVGYRDKTFGWSGIGSDYDALISERACLNIWRNAFAISGISFQSSELPLPAAEYLLKCSLSLDDGNETELKNPLSVSSANALVAAATQLVNVSTNTFLDGGVANGSYICTDGESYYILTYNTELTIKRVNIASGLETGTYSFDPIGGSASAIIAIGGMSYFSGRLYFMVATDDFPAHKATMYSVDSSSMTAVASQVMSDVPNVLYSKYCVLCTNDYVYVTFSTSSTTNRIVKFDITSLAEVSSTVISSSGAMMARDIISIDGDLLVGYDTTPPLIRRIKVSDLSILDTWTVSSAAVGGIGCMYLIDSDNVLIGLNTSPGAIIKLTLSTDTETPSSFVGDYITGFAKVDQYVYAVYGGASGAIANKLDLTSMDVIGSDLLVPTTTNTGNIISIGKYLYALTYRYGSSPDFYRYVVKINTDAGASVSVNGSQEIQLKVLVSPSTILKRARKIKVYISDDGGTFYYPVKEVNLMATSGDVLAVGWDAAAYYDSVLKHFYERTEAITINSNDWDAKGALSSVVLGRDSSDSGAINYKNGTIVGNSTYATNPLIGTPAVNEVNKVVVCANGAGIPMVDVFPNDVANVIDLEYSDGDQIVGALPLADKLFVLKKRSLVLVSANGGGFDRDQISQGIGCCSIKTAKSFEDVNYFCDYNGIYSYSTGSLLLINREWLLDWKLISTAYKEAAIGIIDQVNRKYIVSVRTGVATYKQYALDIDSGEWMQYSWVDAPLQFAINSPDSTDTGSIDFLTSTKIQNLGKTTLQDGSNFTMNWESNEINPLVAKDGYAFDVLCQHIVFEYQSDVAITATVYLDGSSTAFASYSLETTSTKKMVLLPLSAKCKTYRVKYSATTTGANQTVKIKSRIDYFQSMPAGGDVLTA